MKSRVAHAAMLREKKFSSSAEMFAPMETSLAKLGGGVGWTILLAFLSPVKLPMLHAFVNAFPVFEPFMKL